MTVGLIIKSLGGLFRAETFILESVVGLVGWNDNFFDCFHEFGVFGFQCFSCYIIEKWEYYLNCYFQLIWCTKMTENSQEFGPFGIRKL